MPFLTPTAAGEQAVLATYVQQQFAQLRSTAHGLTDEQLRATPTASELSIGSLLRHGAGVANHWGDVVVSAPARTQHYAWTDETMGEEMTGEQVLAEFDTAVGRLADLLSEPLDLSVVAPAPEAPWFDGEAWQRRWVLGLIIAEVARHAGHADIIRESIDGKGSYELNDLADGVEVRDWATETSTLGDEVVVTQD